MSKPSETEIKALREFLVNVQSQMCSMTNMLGEPLKSHFEAMKSKYNEVLDSLPTSDKIPAALEASHHLSCLYSAMMSQHALTNMLTASMDSMKSTTAAALNSAVDAELKKRTAAGELVLKTDVDGLVAAAIDTKVKGGELVTKDGLTQFCSQAKENGIKEGEKKVRDEMATAEVRKTTITTRKTSLATCGLPVPDEKLEGILAGTDDEFKAAQTEAESRISGLQKKGIALNAKSPLMQKVWLPKDQWEVFESLAVETLKGSDPLVTPPRTTGEAPKVMLV